MEREQTTLQAQLYHKNFPKNPGDSKIAPIDPVLVTGGSAAAALNLLTQHGDRLFGT